MGTSRFPTRQRKRPTGLETTRFSSTRSSAWSVRQGQGNDVSRAKMLGAFSDPRRLDAVEQLAEDAGLCMPHLAMALAIAPPAVTTALLGARTMNQLDHLLAGLEVALSDDVLDRIDQLTHQGLARGGLVAAAHRRGPRRMGNRQPLLLTS